MLYCDCVRVLFTLVFDHDMIKIVTLLKVSSMSALHWQNVLKLFIIFKLICAYYYYYCCLCLFGICHPVL